MRTAQNVVSINTGNHRARVQARRDALVLAHMELVKVIAAGVRPALPPCFELDELIAVGNVALVHAATRYRPGAHGGVPFAAYARHAIRGAMLETARRKHWAEATRPGLVVLTARDSDGHREARELEIPIAPVAEQEIDARRLAVRIAEAMSWLSPEEQHVIRVYYGVDEPVLSEVAERMDLTRHKAKVLHLAAIASLRRRLKAA